MKYMRIVKRMDGDEVKGETPLGKKGRKSVISLGFFSV